MPKFCDLLDIDSRICCHVRTKTLGGALGHVMINNQRWDLDLDIQHWCDVLAPIKIQVHHHSKTHLESHEVAVVIDLIQIDHWVMQQQHDHLAQLITDTNRMIHARYLGENGVWTLDVDGPFWLWHHRHTHQGMLIQPAKLESRQNS